MIQDLLKPRPQLAPSKKLRGKRGYFRSLVREAETRELNFSESSWFDEWHHHIDWDGYGNLNWAMRRAYLAALAGAFDVFARRLTGFEKPYQLWMMIAAHDAAFDAVFIHTPNPHGDNFPKVFEGAEWGVLDLSRFFEALLPGYRLCAGTVARDGERYYFVYSPDHGVPLEPIAGT